MASTRVAVTSNVGADSPKCKRSRRLGRGASRRPQQQRLCVPSWLLALANKDRHGGVVVLVQSFRLLDGRRQESIHLPGEGASIRSSSRTASRNPSEQSKNAPSGRTGPGALVFPNERHRFSVVLIDGVRASPYLENSVFWRRVSILLRLLLLIRDNPSYEFPSQL